MHVENEYEMKRQRKMTANDEQITLLGLQPPAEPQTVSRLCRWIMVNLTNMALTALCQLLQKSTQHTPKRQKLVDGTMPAAAALGHATLPADDAEQSVTRGSLEQRGQDTARTYARMSLQSSPTAGAANHTHRTR
jgi:hypothetical protein